MTSATTCRTGPSARPPAPEGDTGWDTARTAGAWEALMQDHVAVASIACSISFTKRAA
jgi:hypothetical protein